MRTVLELAGIQNGFGKQIGSPNPLNNARCTIECLSQMRSMQEIADTRGMTIKEMLTYQGGEYAVPPPPPPPPPAGSAPDSFFNLVSTDCQIECLVSTVAAALTHCDAL